MASSEGTTAPNENNDPRNKGYDDGKDEGYADEESAKTESLIKNGFNLFLTLFKSNFDILEQKVKDLREVADGLERTHFGTTVGSLTGGVVSAVGGVTSVVGLALAPITFGASLAVTWVGLGLATAGGVTSGVSNIVKTVNESMDRKNFEKFIKDYEDLMQPITECLRDLKKNMENLQKLKSIKKKTGGGSPQNVSMQVTFNLGRGLAVSVPEVARLVQAVNLGKVAAQTTRAVQVAGVFSGVLSGLFVGLDVYFITQDAKEIHNINGANKESAAVKFIAVIRETAKQLEDGLDELREVKKMLNECGAQRAQ